MSSLPSAGLRALTAALAGALALAAAASATAAGSYNPDSLDAGPAARVGQVCESVVRLRPGEEHYDSCVESLSDSVRALGQGAAVERARSDCLGRGLTTGSSDLAVCELQSRGAGAARGAYDAGAPRIPVDEPGANRSYFDVAPHTAHRREQLACAELGFEPAGGAFASCVTNLQSALFAADNPMN